MTSEVTQIWKLDSPKMCRDFMASFRYIENGVEKRFETVTAPDGTIVKMEDAPDEVVMQVAKQIADAIEKSQENL